jgi:ATP-dependent DNA helicase RecG
MGMWNRKNNDSCKEAENPMPEYTIKCEDIMVMFKSLVSSLVSSLVNHTNQATDQTIPNEDNSIATRILKVIETEPMLSQKKNRQYYRGEI